MTSPIDTIREALTARAQYTGLRDKGLAALTEVEHQLAAEGELVTKWQSRAHLWNERAEAAETALAEANAYAKEGWDWLAEALDALGVKTVFDIEAGKASREAAERRANQLQSDLVRMAEKKDNWQRAAHESERRLVEWAQAKGMDTPKADALLVRFREIEAAQGSVAPGVAATPTQSGAFPEGNDGEPGATDAQAHAVGKILDRVLDGIDRDEVDGGWWETSTGCELGAAKKAELRDALLTHIQTLIEGERRRANDLTEQVANLTRACNVAVTQSERDYQRANDYEDALREIRDDPMCDVGAGTKAKAVARAVLDRQEQS